MIDFTVKTLDSQNHSFSVADDITVKQTKDVIAESISIPPDTVRLIYCGRVLQDEKKLSDYNVHGKVIHLVQRAPPQSSLGNGSNSANRTNQQRRWTNRPPQMDGSTRYLGTLAIPADLLDSQGLPILQPSHILSRNRLNVARRMIRYMDSLCNRLENPTPENDTETQEEVNSRNNDDADVTDAAEAAAEAIAAAMSAATIERNNQSNSSEESQQQTSTSTNSTQNTSRGISVALADAIAAAMSTNVRNNQTNSAEEAQEQTSTSSNTTQNTSAPRENSGNTNETASSSTSTETGENRNDNGARPADLAEVMSSLMRTRDRADTHMRRCIQLLRDDPQFSSRAETDEAKRVFTGVSALMHHMSHACHALSDIVWVPTTNPPRRLHSSPVLLGQSATLIHSGIPMQQGQLNLLLNRNGNQSQQQTQNSSTNSSSNETRTGSSDSGPDQSEQSSTESPPQSGENTSNDSTQTGINISPSRVTVERTFSLVPANLEFIMEVGPSSITIDALEASVVTNATGNGSNGNGDPNESGNIWGPPQQDFIQNLMQAVAGHVMNRGVPSSTTSTTTSPNSGTTTSTNGNSGNGGGGSQTSQARGNTATHPTTSTQTRSTSRPHVHFAMQAAAHNAAQAAAQVAAAAAAAAASAATGSTASGAASSFASSTYDPFLSCNSIHLRAARRRRQSTQQQQQQQQQGSEDSAQQDQRSQEASSTPTTGRENASSRGTQNNSQNSSSTPGQPPAIGSLYNLIQSLLGTGAAAIGADSPSPTGMPRVVGMVNLPGSPSINLLNLSAGGPMGSEGSLPVLTHLLHGITEGLGGLGASNGNTIADLFENLPDHSYTEGESVFADLVMTLARGLTLQDVLAICLGVSSPLNNLRPELAQFVRHRLLQNQPTSEALYRSAAERINSELRPYLDMLSEARLREDIDLVGSISRCNIERLPQAMRMILEDASETSNESFGARLLTWCQQYGAELCRLALHCSLDGARGLEPVIRRYVQQLTTGVHPTLQLWTSSSSITHVRNYFQRVISQQVDYERYLVYRAAAPPTPSEPLTSMSTPSSTPNNLIPTASSTQLPEPEPMETELTPPPMLSPPRSPPPAPEEPVVVTALAPDPERLPEVIIGSEPWHHALPSDWVPIIARDAQRQQRQRRTAAVALSDAYLAGMPTKRRKEVLASRPSNTESGSPSEGTEPMAEDPPTNSSDPSPGARF